MYYRKLSIEEAERIAEIDAKKYVENVWRKDPQSDTYVLRRIDWTDTELPNGYEWHLKRFRQALEECVRWNTDMRKWTIPLCLPASVCVPLA